MIVAIRRQNSLLKKIIDEFEYVDNYLLVM